MVQHAALHRSALLANLACWVQVTADGVPVIFHDDYLVHGPLWAPRRSLVQDLTLKDFQGLAPLARRFRDATTRQQLQYFDVWRCDDEDVMPTLEQAMCNLPEVRSHHLSLHQIYGVMCCACSVAISMYENIHSAGLNLMALYNHEHNWLGHLCTSQKTGVLCAI